MPETTLAAGAERAFALAETLCQRMDLAIVGPEHLLAAALLVANPEDEALAGRVHAALEAALARGEAPPTGRVMFGSAAREALAAAVRMARAEGRAAIDARFLADAIAASGELHPAFLSALGSRFARPPSSN